ncbi:MAG TPA: hypothetical protein VLE73_02285 [Candidatus Saccharimonadales bacterium]|nr:hypothetical protein [Candidatus Saccharimonadales bacterium]
MPASLPEAFLYSRQLEGCRDEIIDQAVTGCYHKLPYVFREGMQARRRNEHDVRQVMHVGELTIAYGLATVKRALHNPGAADAVGLIKAADTVLDDVAEDLSPYLLGDEQPYVEGVQPTVARRATYKVMGRLAMVRGAAGLARDVVNDKKAGIPWAPDKYTAIGAAHELLKHTGSMGSGDRAMVTRLGRTAGLLMQHKQEAAMWRVRQGFTRMPQSKEGVLFDQVRKQLFVRWFLEEPAE